MRKNAPNTLTVCYVMKPEDVDMAIVNPFVMLASDGLRNDGQGHPRAAGSFARLIDKFVKNGKLSLYDAINKMTVMPAKKLGLISKGHLGVGADADIVIFDLDEIEDRATFENPTLAPLGIEYVIIGGRVALKDGEIICENLGRAVRKL